MYVCMSAILSVCLYVCMFAYLPVCVWIVESVCVGKATGTDTETEQPFVIMQALHIEGSKGRIRLTATLPIIY